MLKHSITVLFMIAFLANPVFGQVKWERSDTPTEPPLALLHSTHVIALPTAETLQKNDLQFEISHRFIPSITKDYSGLPPLDHLYGLDGPVNMRIALGWAPTDKILLFGGRSNLDDNWDVYGKWSFLAVRSDMLPLKAALRAGAAFNTVDDNSVENGNQFYGQLILNTMIAEKLGIGVVPSFVSNSAICSAETKNSVTAGLYAQYYISMIWSVAVEWNSTVSGHKAGFNPFSFGVELETGGHFFKIFVSNSTRLNSTQYLAGSDSRDDWRLGFTITRLLKL